MCCNLYDVISMYLKYEARPISSAIFRVQSRCRASMAILGDLGKKKRKQQETCFHGLLCSSYVWIFPLLLI